MDEKFTKATETFIEEVRVVMPMIAQAIEARTKADSLALRAERTMTEAVTALQASTGNACSVENARDLFLEAAERAGYGPGSAVAEEIQDSYDQAQVYSELLDAMNAAEVGVPRGPVL